MLGQWWLLPEFSFSYLSFPLHKDCLGKKTCNLLIECFWGIPCRLSPYSSFFSNKMKKLKKHFLNCLLSQREKNSCVPGCPYANSGDRNIQFTVAPLGVALLNLNLSCSSISTLSKLDHSFTYSTHFSAAPKGILPAPKYIGLKDRGLDSCVIREK